MCVGGRTRSGQRPRGAGRTERGRARFGRIGRPSSFRDGRDPGRAIESIDRRLRACRKTPPEHARVSAPPGRACLKWRAARPDPPLFRLAGRDAARLREPRRGLESSARAAAGFTGRDARRIRTPPASFRSRPTASLLIRSPLVSFRAIGFRGDARTKARARTFSALCRRAVARGLTGLGRRVDEREFLSCRSRADRCGRCGDRRRFASALANRTVNRKFDAICGFSRLLTRHVRHRVPAFPVSSSRRIVNSCAPRSAARFQSNFKVRDSKTRNTKSLIQLFGIFSVASKVSNRRVSSFSCAFFRRRGRGIRVTHARRASSLEGDARHDGLGSRARVRGPSSRAGGRFRRDASAHAEAGRTTRGAESRAGRRAPR